MGRSRRGIFGGREPDPNLSGISNAGKSVRSATPQTLRGALFLTTCTLLLAENTSEKHQQDIDSTRPVSQETGPSWRPRSLSAVGAPTVELTCGMRWHHCPRISCLWS
ncbi:unnamed protein product [Parajaminaea phylloscopi]